MKVQWLHNGDPLKVQASRMQFQGDDLLVIKDLQATDTGVYECRVDYGGKKAQPVAFFALTVTSPKPTLLVRQAEPLTLDCHSQDMARALHSVDLTRASDPDFKYKESCDVTKQRTTRQWFHNGTKTALLPADSLASESKADTLKSSARGMSGVWRCVVSHVSPSKQWNTSWYRIFVKDPPPPAPVQLSRGAPSISTAPSALSAFSALKKPWFLALVGAVVLAMCIVVAILVARKSGENLEERWGVMETRMMRKASRIGGVDLGISGSAKKNKLDNYEDDSLKEPLLSQTDDTTTPSQSPPRLDNYDDDSLREPLLSQTEDTSAPSRSSSRSLTEEDRFF